MPQTEHIPQCPTSDETAGPSRRLAANRPTDATCLERVLEQLTAVLNGMSDAQYLRSPVGTFECSMGAQIRHVLDHISSLLHAADTGALNYDIRGRGTAVENDREIALEAIATTHDRLRELDGDALARRVRLAVLLDHRRDSVEVETSLGRELAFVLSHTIHHQAIIGAMASMLDVEVPERFGYAPATLAHLEQG